MDQFEMLKFRFRKNLQSLRTKFEGPLLCSDCFTDQGLQIEARKLGASSRRACKNCGSVSGHKLNRTAIEQLAQNFFVYGSFVRSEYGGARVLYLTSWNPNHRDVRFPNWLDRDAALIESTIELGFQYYGPATWRFGEIEPLEVLKDATTRSAAAADVVKRFPRCTLLANTTFYRLRKGIPWRQQSDAGQYDSPPAGCSSSGRLESPGLPLLYGSQDLEICVHECRTTKSDECHLATLRILRPLELLDLCESIDNDGPTPFESLYLAIQFIFSAEEHSYEIARAIAKAAHNAGLDGIIYPSYFSSLRGSSIPNIGLFGYPIADGKVDLVSANRLILETAEYTVRLGPCLMD
jgi:hypothetical protein